MSNSNTQSEINNASAAQASGVPRMGAGAPLGIYAKLRTPPLENGLEFVDRETGELVFQRLLTKEESTIVARRQRFELQSTARDILFKFHGDNTPVNAEGFEKHHRTCACNLKRISTTCQIVKSTTHKKAFFAGLATCANARTCPVCAAPINERKANEMRVAANQLEALRLRFNLLTFTVPHTAGDDISFLVDGISQALGGFWRGSPAARFKKKYGIVGHIRSFEIRHGSNGWHPHFHIIIVTKSDAPSLPETLRDNHRPLPEEQQCDEYRWILDRWKTMCRVAGLDMPNDYGLDIRDGSEAGTYITKFGGDGEIISTKSGSTVTWDVADELTKGNTKKGKNGSRSPWDILADAGNKSLSEKIRSYSRYLFLMYARAMAGVTQLKWSRGLRAIFGLGAALTDEEILAKEEDSADLLCHITPVEWKYIVNNGLRSQVLELAENGGSDAVGRFLFSIFGDGEISFFMNTFKNRNTEANLNIDEDLSRVVTTLYPDGTRTSKAKKNNYIPDDLSKFESTFVDFTKVKI